MNLNSPNVLISTRSDFDECYEYGSEIGKGRYATVKKCYCKKTRKCYAAKIIKNFRTKSSKLNMNIVENEITALALSRSNSSIVNLYEVFYHRGETILILEYATEKDLHLYLDCEGAFEEEKAAQIIYQVLKAVEYLHSKQILHLDIKPENVLLMNPLPGTVSDDKDEEVDKVVVVQEDKKSGDDGPSSSTSSISSSTGPHHPIKVKLCDFSFSQIMQPGKHILGMMGTVAYSAPEVIQYEPLTKATDMWSLGVLTHVLLTEYTPFGNGTEKNMQTETNILSVREKEFKCVEEYFENISSEAQEFIESLLKFRPKCRLTVEEALNHKWFKKFGIIADSDENMSTTTTTVLTENNTTMTTSFNGASLNCCLSIKDQKQTKSSTVTQNNGSSTITTTTLSTHHQQHKRLSANSTADDKNNNILSSLIDVVTSSPSSTSTSPVADIKSSSTSSISSTSSNPKFDDETTNNDADAKHLIRNKYSIDDDEDDANHDDDDDDDLIERLSDCTLLTNGTPTPAPTASCVD